MNMTNLPEKYLGINMDAKLTTKNKTTALNPNAEEFVPSFLKFAHANAQSLDSTLLDAPGSSGKADLHQSKSSISIASDDKAYQYWQQQLPKDITPDFGVTVKEEMCGPQDLSLAGLSIHDGARYSISSTSLANNTLATRKDSFPDSRENFGFNGRMGNNHSVYDEVEDLTASVSASVNSWGKPFLNDRQHSINRMQRHRLVGDYSTGLVNEPMVDDLHIQDCTINPVGYLSEHFPGFARQHLAEFYYANRCDLGSTIQMLNKLKLQVDDDFNQNSNSKSSVAQNRSILDFPALLDADAQTVLSKCSRQDSQHASNNYKISSSLLRGGIDFASAAKNLAFSDTDNWRLHTTDGVSVGSSRSSQLLDSSQNGHGRMNYGDKLFHGSSVAPVSSPWLETGESVGNMSPGSREDNRLGIACFDQAREAYLVADKALIKDLSLKGHVYNTQMKAAREKAREIILRSRNPLGAELHSFGREQDHLIDLRGLHAKEAIEVLIDVLNILRSTARSVCQRLHVAICVGSGLHARSSPTPAVVAVAVAQYLFDKGLNFTQAQPGLLRVAVY